MKTMRNYYISRTIVALAFGALFILIGADWWVGLVAGLIALLGFLWAPRSGRYVRQVQANGQLRLTHDENTRTIADKAARNGFVVSLITLAGLILYFWRNGAEAIPLSYAQIPLLLGILTFWLSDVLIRRGVGSKWQGESLP